VPCSPGMRKCKRDCLHRRMVGEYCDQRDAREALRESGPFMQMEDEEFDREIPQVTFKQWIERGWGHGQRPEGI
jgi:hypothetical protein